MQNSVNYEMGLTAILEFFEKSISRPLRLSPHVSEMDLAAILDLNDPGTRVGQ